MTLNPVILVAQLLEWWTTRRMGRPGPEDGSGECGEGLNIKGKIMSDISEYRIVGREEKRGE